MPLRRLLVLTLALALACSDSGGPDDDDDAGTVKPPSDLTILRLSEDSPPLFNPEVSFYAVRGEGRPELRKRLERRVGAGMLVTGDDHGFAFALRHLDPHELAVEAAVLDRRNRPLMAFEREGVLALA